MVSETGEGQEEAGFLPSVPWAEASARLESHCQISNLSQADSPSLCKVQAGSLFGSPKMAVLVHLTCWDMLHNTPL